MASEVDVTELGFVLANYSWREYTHRNYEALQNQTATYRGS